jgi:type IX secretion system PorP/SprF family membrane protein
MKKVFVIGALFFAISSADAQQKPHYTQYILNNYILNPALSGVENYADVKISGRSQWVGLSGAPKTAYISVHAPIGKKDYKTSSMSYSVPGENPRGSSYWENYTASEPHHGVGFSVVNYQTGSFNRLTANVSYAYHLGLSPVTNLSAGFAAGVSKVGYDRTKARPTDPSDPALGSGSLNFNWKPDLAAGLWLYSSHYFLGLSAQQIIPSRLSFGSATNDSANLVPHFFATGGYRFLLTEDINALPSVMFKYVPGTPTSPQFDLNVKLQYRELFWTGGSYRFNNGFAAMVGLNVSNIFNVGYAYDFTHTALNTASRGTHEVILGFLLGNRYSDACPRNVW